MADQPLPTEPNPNFEPAELLFRRLRPEDVTEGTVNDSALPSPTFSVNRELYCAKEHAIKIWAGFRVAAFKVGDIPVEVRDENGDAYHFAVEHKPEPENYSHSEVYSTREEVRIEDGQKPPKHVRKKFRELLRRKIRILDQEALEG